MTRMSIFTLLFLMASHSVVSGQEPVYFADPNLKRIVEGKLGTRDPNATDMQRLDVLGGRDNMEKVSDLTGLEYATNLTILDLGGNRRIKDFSPLSSLTNLKSLDLAGTDITDLSSLSQLTNLTELRLNRNWKLTDISALSGLTSLTELYLDYNRITDVSALSKLTNLKSLYLNHNKLTDISALSGLTNLRVLVLWENQITAIPPLLQLKNVRKLELTSNQITSIPPIKQLENLQSLKLAGNQLTDIYGLSGLKNLRYLDLRNNRIKDISVLTTLPDLRDVKLDRNPLNEETYLTYMPAIPALSSPEGNRHPDLTPPPLPKAIARADNDYAFKTPYEDQGSELIELPRSVWDKICDVTLKDFNSRYYEELTKYCELFGPVFQIQVPDYENLHLYVNKIEGFNNNCGTIWLILHDCRTDNVAAEPIRFSTRYISIHYPFRPIVHFDDINLDGNVEVVFSNWQFLDQNNYGRLYHYFDIGDDLSLNKIFLLKTSKRFHLGEGKGRCHIDRWIETPNPNQIIVKTVVSENSHFKGKTELGYTVFESPDASSPFEVKQTSPYIAEYAHVLVWGGADDWP